MKLDHDNEGNEGDLRREPEPLLQFFEYRHLPVDLQLIGEHFQTMAYWIERTLPRNPERTVALRKLLEAKDCAIRSMIYTSRIARRDSKFGETTRLK